MLVHCCASLRHTITTRSTPRTPHALPREAAQQRRSGRKGARAHTGHEGRRRERGAQLSVPCLKGSLHGVRIMTIHTNASVFTSHSSREPQRSAALAEPIETRRHGSSCRCLTHRPRCTQPPTSHTAQHSSKQQQQQHRALAHHRCRPDDSSNSHKPVFSMRSHTQPHAVSRPDGYPVEWHRGRGHQGTYKRGSAAATTRTFAIISHKQVRRLGYGASPATVLLAVPSRHPAAHTPTHAQHLQRHATSKTRGGGDTPSVDDA